MRQIVRVCAHMRIYTVQQRVCGSESRCIFVCICSLVGATTHPWQPENTLIFPTLIVKGEVERTEKVCVFVGASVRERGGGGGE